MRKEPDTSDICKACNHPYFRHFTVEESFYSDEKNESCMGIKRSAGNMETKCDCERFKT